MRSKRAEDAAVYTGRAWQRHREFWEGRFALAGDSFHFAGDMEDAFVALDGEAGQALARISGNAALGRMAVVLAALARLFGSLTDAAAFVVDTPPLAEGNGGDVVPLILPIPAGQETVGELLREVGDVVAQSYAFQAFPARTLLGGAATNVLLVCGGVHRGIAARDAYDVVLELGDALMISGASTLADPLRQILAAFGSGARRVGAIDVVSDAERRALVPAPSPAPHRGSLFALFEETARRHGDRVALESPARRLTYAELLSEASARAGGLRRHGVRRGDVVAVPATRDVDWIVSLLAVLGAGGAYLPIDRALPPERVRAYLDETRAATLLLDGAAPDGDGELPHVTGSDLAYVLYTSGSTGRPKGVMVEHGGFVNMIEDQIAVFGIEPADRVLQLASASFDASLSEIFMTLLSGAALVLIDDETIADPHAFTRYVESRGVTAMTVTPLYLAALDRHPLPTVRTLITAGDAAHVATTRHYARSKRVFNAYGPTEVSVCATMQRVDPSRPVVPIGRPVANSAVYVVDRYGRLLPRGAAGEMWFAGPGVARGYVGRDDPSFFDDPFAAGRRCYRTGDRGRWLPDGTLAFEGRADDQLKIRGYRIEPAEIESALRRHPLVGEAHVAAVGEGDRRELAAWVSTRPAIELWPSIAEFFVYDDVVYGAMAAHDERNRSYRLAAERRVAGKVVLEIGPGPEAVLARLCVAAGARKVYAIEISPETAMRARSRVAELGLGERIEIITGDAAGLVLPEPADVCVSEIVGSIGGSEGAAFLINAVRPLMRDPAAQIPARSVTQIAGLSFGGRPLDLHFPEIAAHYVERIFDAAGGPFDLRLCLKNLPAECIVTTAAPFEDLDFTRPIDLEEDREIRLRVDRGGTLDGFLVWLQLVTDAAHPEETVDILRSPGSWLPVFFPIEPLAVDDGDEIVAAVRRRLSANGRNPDFFIDGELRRGGAPVARIAYEAFHAAPGFRRTPFYERLFAGGAIPVRPDASAAGLRKWLAGMLPPYMVPAHVELLDRLPMNRSGKIDRRALPLPRRAPGAMPAAPRNDVEAAVLAVWQEVLERAQLGVDDDFFTSGGDSIRAIQIASRLNERGLRVSTRDILANPTVAGTAQKVERAAPAAPAESIEGPLPLTPIQSWFFERFRNEPGHFNQAVMLQYGAPLDAAALSRAMTAIAAHHDALRSRFPVVDGVVQPAIDPPGDVVVDVTDATPEALQRSLDLGRGPLMRAAIVRAAGGERLLWIVHHLVVDWVSWRILVAGLGTAYAQALRGDTITLSPKSVSIREWAEALRSEGQRDAAHWERVVAAPVVDLPHDAESGSDLVADAATVDVQLDAETTAQFLGDANRAYTTEANDILLTALARALERVRGAGAARVLVETHGRDAAPLDAGRTVGWFTTFHPVLLDLGGERDAGSQLKRIKESLRQVPSHGASYLPFHNDRPHRLPQLSFNYLGQFGGEAAGGWSVAPEPAGPSVSPRSERPCEIELLAAAVDGRLDLTVTYDAVRFRRETALRLLTAFRDEIAAVVRHCTARRESEVTPSDLTYAALSQEEFDSLFS